MLFCTNVCKNYNIKQDFQFLPVQFFFFFFDALVVRARLRLHPKTTKKKRMTELKLIYT